MNRYNDKVWLDAFQETEKKTYLLNNSVISLLTNSFFAILSKLKFNSLQLKQNRKTEFKYLNKRFPNNIRDKVAILTKKLYLQKKITVSIS